MEYRCISKYYILAFCWLIFISYLTVIKVSPTFLNADIIMNSVMSLQKLTLYYWGQNRLLNILPLFASPIDNPSYNLAAVLMLATASFYGLLLLAAKHSVNLFKKLDSDANTLKVFVVLSSLFLLMFNDNAIADITIWHVEYTFPVLLLVASVSRLLFSEHLSQKGWQFSLAYIALFLAIGMNPSVLLLSFFTAFTSLIYRKKLRRNEFYLICLSLLFFIFWNAVALVYGALPYNVFRLSILLHALPVVTEQLIGTFNLYFLSAISLSLGGGYLFLTHFSTRFLPQNKSVISFIFKMLLIFSLGWLLLFSSSYWVELNAYSWRYFTFILFSILFAFSLMLSCFFVFFPPKVSAILACVVAVGMLLSQSLPSYSINFNDYQIFQLTNALTPPGKGLYSGDYWVVWPSVFRDMLYGFEAYGLTYRGDSNAQAAIYFINNKISQYGYFEVFCLKETAENCISEINKVVGSTREVNTTKLSENVISIKLILTE